MLTGREIHGEPRDFLAATPRQIERVIRRLTKLEGAAESGVLVAQPNEIEESLHAWPSQRLVDLGLRVAMPVDVAADARSGEQRHVVRTGEQADVVHLRHSGQKELDGSGEQVFAIVSAKRVVKRAVDLV